MEYEYPTPLSGLPSGANGSDFADRLFDRYNHDAYTADPSSAFKIYSLDVINGWLDYNNITESVNDRKIKHNCVTQLYQTSGNANLDLFDDITGITGDADAPKTSIVAVPGASKSFRLTRASDVLVTWSLVVSNAGRNLADEKAGSTTEIRTAGFFLFVDDLATVVKLVGKVNPGLLFRPVYVPRFDARIGKACIQGHTMLSNLSPGMHDIGIAMIAKSEHVRIHTRRLNIMAFGRGV